MENKIRKLAVRFRSAIETAKELGEQHIYLKDFPVGQCGHVSDLLAQYLIDCGIYSVIYVNGTYYGDKLDDQWSHTWLEVDEIVVDLTADQFKYHERPLQNNTSVYVGKKNSWYDLFDIGCASCHQHKGLDTSWTNYYELKQCYDIINLYL